MSGERNYEIAVGNLGMTGVEENGMPANLKLNEKNISYAMWSRILAIYQVKLIVENGRVNSHVIKNNKTYQYNIVLTSREWIVSNWCCHFLTMKQEGYKMGKREGWYSQREREREREKDSTARERMVARERERRMVQLVSLIEISF